MEERKGNGGVGEGGEKEEEKKQWTGIGVNGTGEEDGQGNGGGKWRRRKEEGKEERGSLLHEGHDDVTWGLFSHAFVCDVTNSPPCERSGEVLSCDVTRGNGEQKNLWRDVA